MSNQNNASVTAPEESAGRWYVLAVLMLVYALNIADRFVVSTVLEPMRLELQLSDSAIGFLTGVALALFYVTVGLPVARLADRSNRRNIIVVALAVWSVMTACCGLARNVWHFLLARFAVGIGEAGGTPPSTSLLADRFTPAQRPLALTLFGLGAPLGAWLGSQVAGALADAFGWRAAFLGLGVPGVALAAILLLTVREPARGRYDVLENVPRDMPDGAPGGASVTTSMAASTAAPGLRDTLRWLLENRAAFHTLMGGTIGTLWGWGLLWWTPAFLMRRYGMTAGEAGELLGPMHLLAGTVATLATGYLLSRPLAAGTVRTNLLMAVALAASTLPSIAVYWTDSRAVAVVMLWCMMPAVYLFIGPTLGILQNLVPPPMRAQVVAMMLFTANVANLVIAPQGVGIASDLLAGQLGGNGESLRWALLVLSLSGFWAAWHYGRGAAEARSLEARLE